MADKEAAVADKEAAVTEKEAAVAAFKAREADSKAALARTKAALAETRDQLRAVKATKYNIICLLGAQSQTRGVRDRSPGGDPALRRVRAR